MGYKNFWILLVLLLSGIVLGSFIGDMAQNIPGLSWLNFGQTFGLDSPLIVNLGMLVVTFGLTIRITMASIIGVALALVIYRMI
ncbi:MAG: DUF4321 domain-containing protein [Hungatella sp.]|nr:DUF4321 domain-containing protein [Hungatella sp.]